MTDIILHHYDRSPYAEKVRTGLGLKGLAWASVELPIIMPKPNLTALTGGYRKTPVLQVGADIYCDSQLIMRELERRYPTPSFYPAGHGAADALAWWAEKTTFSPAVSIAFAKRRDALPEGFLEDRAKFSGRNIDPIAMMAAVPNLLDQLRAHFDWLDQTALVLARPCRWPRRSRRLSSGLVLATEFRIGGAAARWLSEAPDLG
jgi:glutathione S-transferase